MNTKRPQEMAGREARKAARRGREFAEIFFQYADCLHAGGPEWRAEELRALGRSKLGELREALSDCEDWARLARLPRAARAARRAPESAAA